MVIGKERLLKLCAKHLVELDHPAKQALNLSDWDYFLNMASHHSIGPLLYHNLAWSEEHVPSVVIEHLKNQYYLNTIRNEFLFNELTQILETMKEARVETIILKGAALAETAYLDRGLRSFSDIDILIRKECLNKAENILTNLGYTLDVSTTSHSFSERFDYHLRYIKGASIVELHWDLGLGVGIYKYTNIKVDTFWRNAQRARVAGMDTLIPSPEDLIIHSCIHSAKHKYSKLIWLCDIRQIAKHQQVDWDYLIRSTKSYHTARQVFYGLFFAEELLGPILPKHVLTEFRPPVFEVRLFRFFIYKDSFSIFNLVKDMVLRFLLIDKQIDRLKFLATYPFGSLAYLLCSSKKRTLKRIKEGTVGL